MANKPRKQHFLPQKAYLKQFACPDSAEKIYCYDRRRKKDLVPPSSFDNVGCEGDLYTFLDADGKLNYTVETHIFGQIDYGLIPLLDRINHSLTAVQLTPSLLLSYAEIIDLSSFAAFQMMRTPTAIQTLEESFLEMRKKSAKILASNKKEYHKLAQRIIPKEEYDEALIEKSRRALLDDTLQMRIEKNSYFLGLALQMTQDALPIFLMKDVIILKTPPGKHLLTSDHPIIKLPNQELPLLLRGGMLGSHIYFPVGSHTAILFLTRNEAINRCKHLGCIKEIPVKVLSPSQVDELNEVCIAHAENFVLSAFKDEELQRKLKNSKKPKRFQIT